MPAPGIAEFDAYFATQPAERAEFLPLAEGTSTVPVFPRFILGALPEPLSLRMLAPRRTGPVGCHRIRDIGVSYDGIMLDGATALRHDGLNHLQDHVEKIAARIGEGAEMRRRRLDRQAVLMTGPGYTVFGHWLVDMLPRLFVLQRCGFDLQALHYLIPDAAPPFVRDLLQAFGILPNQLVAYSEHREVLEVAELITPTNLRFGDRFHSLMRPAAGFLRDLAIPRGHLTGDGSRLFISRRDSDTSRTVANRERLEEIAAAQGYRVVQPETLPVAGQIALFAGAGQIAGEYGSGLHLSMFAEPGTAILAVRGSSEHPGFIQSGLCEVLGQTIGYVLADTPYPAIHQHMTVAEGLFAHGLDTLQLLTDERGRDAVPNQEGTPDMLTRDLVVQRCLELFDDPAYLEIGVSQGVTFHAVTAAHKVAVDPHFQFAERQAEAATYHEITSDDYFARFSEERFDVIFLDGLHTFEQTLRDLLNAMRLLNPGGIIVVDDVIPNSYVAALPDLATSIALREHVAAQEGRPVDLSWMGDVFKIPFFVDTFMQQFSFATVAENHGQTIIWEQVRPAPAIAQRTLESISRLEFKDSITQRGTFKIMPLDQIIAQITASGPSA